MFETGARLWQACFGRQRTFDLLRDSKRVVLGLPGRGGVELDDGRLLRVVDDRWRCPVVHTLRTKFDSLEVLSGSPKPMS